MECDRDGSGRGRGTLIRQLGEILESYPLIVMPVSSEQAFEQDADIASVESMRRLMAAQASMMAILAFGFPAMSVPTGVASGPPRGGAAARTAFRRGNAARSGHGHRDARRDVHANRPSLRGMTVISTTHARHMDD